MAVELTTLNSSVRALGMGDAFTAVADDSSSLFYNPAGLARVSGINWKIFSLGAGASGVSAYEKVKSIQDESSDEFSDTLQELTGEHISAGFGGQSIFTAPMIGFGVYNHTSARIRVDNPVYPQFNANVLNDYGYVLGFGIPVAPILHIGANLRYIKRSGANVPFGAADLADLDADAIYERMTAWGKGYGADLGMNLVLPTPILSAAIGVAWKNIGGINFKSETGAVIPRAENDLTLGAAVMFDTPILSVTPAVDFKALNRTDLQLTRKINFGIEIGLPLIDIRGGYHEGYYTVGAGVDLALFRFDVATYGVELGAYPGQIEDRRYVAQFTMELGIGNFTASGVSKSGSGSSGRSGGGGKSFWGGRKRLKQRR